MVGGKNAHPVFHVGHLFQIGDITCLAVRIRGVHNGKDIGEVIEGISRAPDLKAIAVARRLFDAAGGGVRHNVAPGLVIVIHVISRKGGRKFEPRLHLVKITGGVIGEALFNQIAVRHLRVFH